MKILAIIFLVLIGGRALSQTAAEDGLVKLSATLFRWEVEKKTDSIAQLLSDKFIVLNSAGQTQSKTGYVTRLTSGNFVHNSVNVEQSAAIILDNTGTVTGRGTFTITVNGEKRTVHLAYLEVFIKTRKNCHWLLLALHASVVSE